MKLLVLFIAISLPFMMVSSARAVDLNIGEQLEKIPALKQGIAYSLLENEVSYLSTIEVINWKGIALEAGYSSTDKAVAVISYELLKLKDLGVNVPILNLIEARVGLYGGYGRIGIGFGNAKDNNEWDAGLSLTLVNLKF